MLTKSTSHTAYWPMQGASPRSDAPSHMLGPLPGSHPLLRPVGHTHTHTPHTHTHTHCTSIASSTVHTTWYQHGCSMNVPGLWGQLCLCVCVCITSVPAHLASLRHRSCGLCLRLACCHTLVRLYTYTHRHIHIHMRTKRDTSWGLGHEGY